MKPAVDLAPLLRQALALDAGSVDRLYGLEPVFEPGSDPRQRPLSAQVARECPYCWQSLAIEVDLTLGAQAWIEDCQHCCQPVALSAEIVDDGRGARVQAERAHSCGAGWMPGAAGDPPGRRRGRSDSAYSKPFRKMSSPAVQAPW